MSHPAYFCFLRQSLTMYLRLAWDSCFDWPQTQDPPAYASQVLGLEACVIMPISRFCVLKSLCHSE
jgi:hypothetical protein